VAVVDDGHRLAEPLDQVQLVAREEDQPPLTGGVGDDLGQPVDGDRVEPGEGLVEHERLRLVDERNGELHPLLVAQRQRLDRLVGAVGDAQPLEQGVGAERGALAAQAGQPGEVDELVADAHVRVEPALLGHVAEAPPDLGADRLAAVADLSPVGLDHAEDDPHGGGLPGAVRAEEPADLAGRHRHGEVVGGDPVPEALGQPADLEHSTHAAPGPRRRKRAGPQPPAALTR
jgi:hypothetical protein